MRQRGAAAILAMMFLVIFASLATAMAIVAEGNLRTADSQLKVKRALAAAQTGMDFITFRINQVLASDPAKFSIPQGEVDTTLAKTLWTKISTDLVTSLANEGNFSNGQPYIDATGAVRIPPISVGPGCPSFTAVLMEHPIPDNLPEDHPLYGHSYDSAFYKRPPYDGSMPDTGITSPISGTHKLDARWVRIRVQAVAGPTNDDGTPKPTAVTRSISMDFRIEKKIRAAILSKSRVMIGPNVMIEGRIGSNFTDTSLPNGHPIQMVSNFRGLADGLDKNLDDLATDLHTYDLDGDNRLLIDTEVPPSYQGAMKALDENGDGYVDDWDLFMSYFDGKDGASPNGQVSLTELEAGGVDSTRAAQLIKLIDTFYNPPGSQNGVIDNNDRYAKVRGEVLIAASQKQWEEGAANGPYQKYFQGSIHPNHGEQPMTFQADTSDFPNFDQKDFDVSQYHDMADGGKVAAQAASEVGSTQTGHDAPAAISETFEAVPYGSVHPYDYYDRPVYENMTFTNVVIPKGTNALFKNCTFEGVTYVEVETSNYQKDANNEDVNDFNYAGMQEADGSVKFPAIDQAVKAAGLWQNPDSSQPGSKAVGANIRFDSCRFEGVVVSGGADGASAEQPDAFSNTRNKLTFTGQTEFPDVMDKSETPTLTDTERDIFRRGRIIAPHMSVEMGTFDADQTHSGDDSDPAQTLHLTGTIVAGVLDMRGNIVIDGTILTTYEPTKGDGTVLGDTSPQFNTTLGYFTDQAGDEEYGDQLPNALGVIQLRYDPTLPLPNGILSRVDVTPLVSTYTEGGAQCAATE